MTPRIKDAAWLRWAVVAIGTTAVVGGIMVGAMLLSFRTTAPPTPETWTINAGLVELPEPPTPAEPTEATPSPPPVAPRQAEPEPEPQPIPLKRPPLKRVIQKPKAAERPKESLVVSSRPQPTVTAPSPAPSHEDRLATNSNGAHAIFQPPPVIPPELRRHPLNLAAVVRFEIAKNGSANAQFQEATPIPELNQVLLDTFRRWRFFPAMEHGQPVNSVLVLRVPVRVE